MKKCTAIFLAVLLFCRATVVFAGVRDERLLVVEAEIAGMMNGGVGMVYRPLTGGEEFSYNRSLRFQSASTLKIPVVLCVYQLAAEGKLDLDETMRYTAEYHNAAEGFLIHQPLGTVFTLRQLVQYAVKVSDNIAYNMLRARLGNSLYTYTRSLGGAFSNQYNCDDVALYMDAVYRFTQENPVLGEEFLGFFVDTKFEDRLPAGVPGLKVAHKIGRLTSANIAHDAAVVFDEQPYILVIMTSGADNNQPEFFARLSRLVNERHRLLYQDYPVDMVLVDGARAELTGAYLSKGSDRLMVPLGGLFRHMGLPYAWDGDLKAAVFDWAGATAFVFTEHSKLYVGSRAYACETALRGGTAFVAADGIRAALNVDIQTQLTDNR